MRKYNYKDNKINTIINNPYNKIFFQNSKFHNDIDYKIEDNQFIVISLRDYGNGKEVKVYARYELNGSKIGDYIQTINQ